MKKLILPPHDDPSWQQTLDEDFKFATGSLIHNRELPPHFLLHTPERVRVIIAGWETAEQLSSVLARLILRSRAYDAFAISHFAAAWVRVVMGTGEGLLEMAQRVSATDPVCERDQECLLTLLTYRAAGGGVHIIERMSLIERDGGRVTGLAPMPQFDSCSAMIGAGHKGNVVAGLKVAVSKCSQGERQRARLAVAADTATQAAQTRH